MSRGKSILIQIHRNADPAEEEICTGEEPRLLGGKPRYSDNPDSEFYQTKPHPVETNSWLLITDTTAPKISKIFDGIPQDKPIHCRLNTGCVLVGSHLYDIGGCGYTRATMFHMSNQIRRLDCNNLHDQGWKSEDLSIYCTSPVTAVYGNLIYMFPGGRQFTKIGAIPDHPRVSPPSPWAYVYDTVKHKGYNLDLPDDCQDTSPSFCASVEGRRVLVPIKGDDGKMRLYMHKTDEWVWEKMECDENEKDKLFDDHYSKPFAVSNGILYVWGVTRRKGTSVLYCYNISPWSFIGRIKLPDFDNYDSEQGFQIFIVPVGDFELCFLWYEPMYKKDAHLYYAKVSVSFKPPALTATLLNQAVFNINANGLINCIPYEYDRNGEGEDDCLRFWDAKVKERSHDDVSTTNKRKKSELEEVDHWKKLCVDQQEELRRKEEEIQSLRKLLQKHN